MNDKGGIGVIMKYIKTKDNIYKTEWFEQDSDCYFYYLRDKKIYAIKKEEVIAQADTIEELCDFVDIQYVDETWEIYSYKEEFKLKLLFKNAKQAFYGIRTDKGLIYVAKMNENGELKLI